MEDIDVVDVKIVSNETIKPSIPTPSHLKTYTLSLVDQIHPTYYTTMLLFYPKSGEMPPDNIDVNVLKIALSKTLSVFYPFAGRCMNNYTVSCSDEGILFVETRVNCALSDFLNSSNKIDHLHKLTPPPEFKAEEVLSKLVPLAFQVNVFSCGGVVIGCYKLHKLLLDGTSLVVFLKHWAKAAATTSRRDMDNIIVPVAPDFNAILSAFPPRQSISLWPFDTDTSEYRAMVRQYQYVHVVAKNFVFTKDTITVLRAMSASKDVPKPSRVEALAGFIWEHCMAAAYAAVAMPMDPDPSVMSLLVNMRPRLNPPLTSACMGNLVTTVSARANRSMDLPDLVRVIHEAVSNVSNKIDSYKCGENVEAIIADSAPPLYYKPGTYGLSSWCQFGLDEVDFGFGKPSWASPTNGILSPISSRNFIYFSCDTNGDGIEVWLYLEQKEMQLLETNRQFLAYAFLN